MKLYLAFPICDEFQRHELDRMSDQQRFALAARNYREYNQLFIYEKAQSLFEDLNSESIESTCMWFYEVEVPANVYYAWLKELETIEEVMAV